MLLPVSSWVTAFKQVNRDRSHIRLGHVDRQYRFPEPPILLTLSTPERRKLFCANWLAARPLWISRIEHNPPPQLPTPQIWRDFLNSIPTNVSVAKTTTQSGREKLAAKELFGDALVQVQSDTWAGRDTVEWRGQQIAIVSLADPPPYLMRCILWELYELGFRYELLALDRALVPRLWEDEPEERTDLLYSIFPGEGGLVMWQDIMPTQENGLWASPEVAFPFIENWRVLLAMWPGCPSQLTAPLHEDKFTAVTQFEILSSACTFYAQQFFDLFGRAPIVPHRVPS
jgi:hypothetical protein